MQWLEFNILHKETGVGFALKHAQNEAEGDKSQTKLSRSEEAFCDRAGGALSPPAVLQRLNQHFFIDGLWLHVSTLFSEKSIFSDRHRIPRITRALFHKRHAKALLLIKAAIFHFMLFVLQHNYMREANIVPFTPQHIYVTPLGFV